MSVRSDPSAAPERNKVERHSPSRLLPVDFNAQAFEPMKAAGGIECTVTVIRLAPIRVAGSVVCALVPITAEREGGTDLPGCLAA